jgi:subtilisin family serine protease
VCHRVTQQRLIKVLTCSLACAASLQAPTTSTSVTRVSGTTLAAAHVSGALASIWAAFPNCKADVVRKAMQVSARDLGAPGRDNKYGHGLLQAEAATKWLQQQPCAK